MKRSRGTRWRGVSGAYQAVEEEAVIEGMAGVFERGGPVLRSSGVENELCDCLAFVLDVWRAHVSPCRSECGTGAYRDILR